MPPLGEVSDILLGSSVLSPAQHSLSVQCTLSTTEVVGRLPLYVCAQLSQWVRFMLVAQKKHKHILRN